MKAVVMAGGTGSRLRPMLAGSINKHLCPVGGKPLIHWPLNTLAQMGITEVFVMGNGPRFLPVMEEIGTGKQFGLNVSYVYEPETDGQSVGAHLLDIQSYLKEESFILMLGDSVYLHPISRPSQDKFQTWAMPVNEVWDDMKKYPGVPGNEQLIQTGAWVFPPELFKTIEQLQSTSATVRIRDIVSAMCKNSHTLAVNTIKPDSFIDCGTTSAVNKINALCATK
jgi:NDP-sugar pyrophosphorylase family protein